MKEHFFKCPYCSATISMIVDLSAEEQSYVEDCEVCCQPIQINLEVENGKLSNFQARALEE